MVWPYVEEVARRPEVDDMNPNPYTPPRAEKEIPISNYVLAVREEAEKLGFHSLGRFIDGRGGIYMCHYEFWVSLDCTVLAMVETGSLLNIPVDATSMFTRLGDGRCLATLDDPKAASTDASRLTDQFILRRADFRELLKRHQQRIKSAPFPALAYQSADPLADHRAFRLARAQKQVDRKLAKFLDAEHQRYKYTVKGALLTTLLANAREWIRIFRDAPRASIARPGSPGYVSSETRVR